MTGLLDDSIDNAFVTVVVGLVVVDVDIDDDIVLKNVLLLLIVIMVVIMVVDKVEVEEEVLVEVDSTVVGIRNGVNTPLNFFLNRQACEKGNIAQMLTRIGNNKKIFILKKYGCENFKFSFLLSNKHFTTHFLSDLLIKFNIFVFLLIRKNKIFYKDK